MACGAKVASMPVLIGVCASAGPAAASQPAVKAANKRQASLHLDLLSRFKPASVSKTNYSRTLARGEPNRSRPGCSSDSRVRSPSRPPTPRYQRCTYGLIRASISARARCSRRQALLAEGAYLPEQRLDVHGAELAVLDHARGRRRPPSDVLPQRALDERLDDVRTAGRARAHPLDPREVHEHRVGFHARRAACPPAPRSRRPARR